jgi:hypothetical protein
MMTVSIDRTSKHSAQLLIGPADAQEEKNSKAALMPAILSQAVTSNSIFKI